MLAWSVFPLKIEIKCTFAILLPRFLSSLSLPQDTSYREDLTQINAEYWSFLSILPPPQIPLNLALIKNS